MYFKSLTNKHCYTLLGDISKKNCMHLELGDMHLKRKHDMSSIYTF